MPRKKRRGLETPTFYHYADQYRKHITEEEEIEKIDMTETFFTELMTIVDVGELINMNINAPPTSGKSLTGMAIMNEVMKAKFGRELDIRDIDRDQQEYSRRLRDPDIKKTCRVIDEWNELETIGENSTVERAVYNYMSDVMAQRFIHKCSCSPSENPDRNALIYLEVISTDKVRKVNHCKLYYKIATGGMETRQLIGMVSIDVSEILAKQWYKEYRRRKFKKMSLILEEGIYKDRLLQYAGMTLEVIERLRKLTRINGIVNPNIVRNYIRIESRKRKIPQSIVGEELATREVLGVLDLWKAVAKIAKEIKAHEKEQEKMKKEQDLEGAKLKNMKIEELMEMRREIQNAIDIQESELKRYMQINEEFEKIEEEKEDKEG